MRILSVIVLVVVSISFMHCGGGSDPAPPTAEEVMLAALTANGGKWGQTAGSTVEVDGTDFTSELFAGFTITFTSGTNGNAYTTTGTTPVWSRSDTWSFKEGSDGEIIVRGDNIEVEILSISATELVLQMQWDELTTDGGGRTRSIPGTHVFTLKK